MQFIAPLRVVVYLNLQFGEYPKLTFFIQLFVAKAPNIGMFPGYFL
jgi:hypothetical protein